MQTERLKSLVETGDYRPEPALVAEAMLRRRGVRELLVGTGRRRSTQLVEPRRLQRPPPGSLISTPSPATTSPIRVSVSLPRPPVASAAPPPSSRSGGSAASSS